MIQRYLFTLIFIICSVLSVSADDNKSYKCEGTQYSSTGGVKSNSKPVATGFTWKDTKGNIYPIYISNSGSCYVIKTSKKTGKEYKYYLVSEISKDICKKLGKEYKGKNEK